MYTPAHAHGVTAHRTPPHRLTELRRRLVKDFLDELRAPCLTQKLDPVRILTP